MEKLKKYYQTILEASKVTNTKKQKCILLIIIDMIWCTIIYGASPNNYLNFAFYDLNHKKRKTYLTHRHNQKIIVKYNNNNYRDIFENKAKFLEYFKQYIGREWIKVEDDNFEAFKRLVITKGKVICKPLNLGQGKGIEVLHTKDFCSIITMFDYIKDRKNNFGIVEEFIEQHPYLSNVYKESVNAIRVVTIVKNRQCNILYALITFGHGNKIANLSSGGLCTPVNVKTGSIQFPVIDKSGNIYNEHPSTGISIIGLQIPFWHSVLDLAKEASLLMPYIRYVGWDIAITKKGPILIEGNHDTGYTTLQNPVYVIDQIGMKPIYSKFL